MLQRFTGLRFMTGQSQRRSEECLWKRVVGPNRDRTACPVDRLIVLLQPEIRPRFPKRHELQRWIVRTEPNRLVEYFQGLFILPEVEVIPAHPLHGGYAGRVQGERPFLLRNGLLEARLVEETQGLCSMSPSGSRVE